MTDLVQIGEKAFLYDFLEKLFAAFFPAVSTEPITYNGYTAQVKPVIVSPDIFRGFTCPEQCGACCRRGTLDYLPFEDRPLDQAPFHQERYVEVNGKKFKIISDLQTDHSNLFCRHLDSNTRCLIYQNRPFACDFPLFQTKEYDTYRWFGCTKFGRHKKWLRVDGQRGTKCDLLPITQESLQDARRRLGRLQQWIDYFGINNRMAQINTWANQDPPPTDHLRLGFSTGTLIKCSSK